MLWLMTHLSDTLNKRYIAISIVTCWTIISGMMAEVTTVLSTAGISICSCVVSG